MDQQRRAFLKLAATGSLSFAPLVKLLATNPEEEDDDSLAEDLFNNSREIHYLDKNLANIHIYFINVVRKRRNYIPEDPGKNCFLIFSIPNQHLSEQFYADDPGQGVVKNPMVHLSGFSFLAFQLWKDVRAKDRKLPVAVKNLLNWEDIDTFHFITTKDVKNRLFHSFSSVCHNTLGVQKASVVEDKAFPDQNVRPNDLSYYKDVLLGKLLTSNQDENGYLSILELPAKLFITPHLTQKGWKARFETCRLDVRTYHFASSKRIRTIQELWNARLYIDRSEGTDQKGSVDLSDYPPVFRVLGFRGNLTCQPENPCKIDQPPNPELFLPQLIDRAELTYLNQLSDREPQYQGEGYDLKATSDFTFTALGATAKLHYKNLKTQEPVIDLVEYEHHFTQGRDEYIKVARIGVIAATGQKALYVQIARRRYNKNNQLYLQYKQYIELVEYEKEYEQGLKQQDVFPVRHHSFFWKKNAAGMPQPQYQAGSPYYQTNYRRFPFRKIRVTEEIKNKPILTCEITRATCPDPIGYLPSVFWVLNKADETDFELNGHYWDKDVRYEDLGKMEFAKPFSVPVLFIRKSVFVSCTGTPPVQSPISRATFQNDIFRHFVSDRNKERRKFKLFEKNLAFTHRYNNDPARNLRTESQTEEAKSNSTNSPKAKFFEYYFDPKDWSGETPFTALLLASYSRW